MATSTNQITAPRVDFLDQNGKISREWYMYLYNLYTITGAGSGITPVINGGTGLSTIPTNGQLLIGNGTGYTLNTLGAGTGISVTNGAGTITVANTGVLSFSGGTTGLTPVAAAVGVVTLGGTLIAANGGTGFASYAIGDLLYANTTTTLAKLPDVATGNALISGGVNTAPSWGKIGLTTHVSGVLPIANGGTNGTATPTAYGVSYGTGTTYAFTAAGTTGQVLTATTGGAPTWAAPATSGTVTSVGLSLPSQFTVTNSPVTSSGTLTGSWNNQTSNYVLAGPTSGAAAAPTFRALVSGDIPSLNYVTSVTGTAPVVSSGGLTPAISMAAANTSTNGYLTSTDWNTFNNKGSGTVTAISVASANGFAGTSSGGATPALTLTTSISGVLYGNGTAIAAATISAPLAYSAGTLSITQSGTSTNGYLSSTDWNTFNNKGSGTVTSVTGTAPVVSSGGTTPAISMAAANTTTNGYLTSTDWNTFNNKGSGTVTSVSFTGGIITVANGTTTPAFTVAGTSGGIPYFSSGTTWASSAALTQYGVVYGGGAGAAPVATAAGTTGQVLTATTGGAPTWATPAAGGTVTTVSVVSANGFAGTVANPTTTPAITLTTSITGLLKGNGTAISAAVVNTDYFAPSAPVTKTADFTVAATDVWLINNKSGSTCTATLPTASSWSGRVLRFQNYQAQALVSASSNVVPLTGGAAATSILLASSGDSATLVSDGTNWLMTQYIPNNSLLLE
jgi:hypothetical protein